MLKGSVIVLIGENKNVAVQGDQIRINEGNYLFLCTLMKISDIPNPMIYFSGVAYAFENTGKTAALLYYTK